MALKLGLNGKLYVGAPGTGGAEPTEYTLLNNVKDVTINLDRDKADVTTRSAAGFKVEVGTLANLSIEFDSVWDETDAGLTILFDAFKNNTTVWVKAVDSADAGAKGVKFPASVTSFKFNQQLTEAQTVSISVSPTFHTVNGTYAPPQFI